jgi:hypothetical protein
MLGTEWNDEKIREFTKEGNNAMPDKFILPLAYIIEPRLKEMLKPRLLIGGKEYEVKAGEEIDDLMSLSKDDFLKLMGKQPRKNKEL